MSDDPRKVLDDALEALATAKTPSELVAAKARVARDVRRGRRRDAKTWGPLAQTYAAAMTEWDSQKALGAPLAERVANFAKSLKAAWPVSGRPYFACEACDDVGWQSFACTPETPCGRPFTVAGQAPDDFTGRGRCTPGHAYVKPCFCEKGRGKARALEGRPPTPEDFTKAGKSKDFTRMGR